MTITTRGRRLADIARSYLFLAGPEAGLVNGAAIPV